jgi:Tol biopolymer transport system component
LSRVPLAGFVVAAVFAGTAAGGLPTPRLTGTLAFGTGQYVFAVHADGSDGHAVVAGDYPAFSTAGGLAYTLNGIWVARSDGSSSRHIVPRFAEYLTYADPTWSPDGTHLAYIRVDNGHETSELWVVRADGEALHGLSIVHVAETPAWSPDGKWIAYVGDGGLSEVLADGSGKRVLLHREVASPAWSPTGNRIAFEEQSGRRVELWTYDLATHALRLVERHGGSVGPLAWSPDGRWLAFTEGGEIRAVRVTGGRERSITKSYVQRIDGLTWRR